MTRKPVPFSLDAELAGLGYTPADILRLIAADIEFRRTRLENLAPPENSGLAASPAKSAKRVLRTPAAKAVKTLVKRRARISGSAFAADASAPKPPKAPKPAGTLVKRRPLSDEARANIVAAQKLRWANYHAAKTPAA